MIRFALTGMILLGLTAEGLSQTQARLCYALPSSPFCQNVNASNPLPVKQGSTTTATGVEHLVRLCYAVPNSPFCQIVDAAHPLPVQ